MQSLNTSPVTSGAAARITISVDAMGGDKGPAVVVAGLVDSIRQRPDLDILLHGDQALLQPLLEREPGLKGRVTLRHAPGVVTMEDKPAQVMRHGQDTSMWATIDSVRDGAAAAAVSCGNTGALMAVSMIRLRKLPGINRPAIACLWPSRNPGEFNVMLDVGADVKADPSDLLQYAVMGSAYAANGLSIARPRVGLLNVGTEEHKGRAELKEANELLAREADRGGFQHMGFVEGSDIPGASVDVIVTDGFTGNVALKTGEGTARLVAERLKESFTSGLLAKIGALLALPALKRFQKRIDPRRANGGVFLGLRGTVVKSHGGSDATGIAAAIGLAYQLALSGLTEGIAARLASIAAAGQDAPLMAPGDSAGAGIKGGSTE
ncbi:phosphate acyltransferase PlsX [Pseudogemmobacter faecipullorum]|uniref:Phosphate acyltransferase n=1 Tax=Pseudogemmobacter faecipullorum TaxID=2755041 RepID=A0ABS8CIS9_9RHOB|nr:phosphate acyltransferase PlsX [Pseudogemmobacter faecipullorum]MCB5409302.1 phosphate acyltransferase PlsX [Pseudogemmobacter faecipullorum]